MAKSQAVRRYDDDVKLDEYEDITSLRNKYWTPRMYADDLSGGDSLVAHHDFVSII